MAKKKARTPQADTKSTDESPDQKALRLLEHAKRIDSRPWRDLSHLDVAHILWAAEEFLEAHADYQELPSDYKLAEALAAAEWLRRALADAWVTTGEYRIQAPRGILDLISEEVRQLLDSVVQSPFAVTSLVMGTPQVSFYVPYGSEFPFDQAAVKKIASGARKLRRCLQNHPPKVEGDPRLKEIDDLMAGLQPEDWDDLQPLHRRLLLYMRDKLSADLDDLCNKVWGQDCALLGNGALPTAISRVNSFLKRHGWKPELHKVYNEKTLVWRWR